VLENDNAEMIFDLEQPSLLVKQFVFLGKELKLASFLRSCDEFAIWVDQEEQLRARRSKPEYFRKVEEDEELDSEHALEFLEELDEA